MSSNKRDIKRVYNIKHCTKVWQLGKKGRGEGGGGGKGNL